MLKPLIDQLASELGMTLPTPKEDGSFVLHFEPGIMVTVKENQSKGITLFARLSHLQSDSNEELFCTLMGANLFGRETGNGMLGLDKEGKVITLSCFLPEEVNYQAFHEAMEEFVNYAESWRDDLVKMQKEKGMRR